MSSEPLNKWLMLSQDIKRWGTELGFQQVGIADINLESHKIMLQDWLDKGFHADMSYMSQNVDKRLAPEKLLPGTLKVITVRLDYLPENAEFASNLKDPNRAYISRYATGRDYHKVIRGKLKKLGQRISNQEPSAQWRPFTDSAPILEHALAQNGGIGWTGKHSLTLNKKSGSWFFLGELFVNLPLPTDEPQTDQCGQCVACIKICPTKAIVAPYVVDAKRCISYLTIENKDDIPVEFRKAIGNRIYGCDDCQLICPWNRYGKITKEDDFRIRHGLTNVMLLELFDWGEDTFLNNMQGSAIRRIGHQAWLRNIAVALGNADYDANIVKALKDKKSQNSNEKVTDMVVRHIDWALQMQEQKAKALKSTTSQNPDTTQKSDIVQESTTARDNPNRLTLRLIRTIKKGLPRDA